ncbi:MAG: tetratricopeptide repeat protein [Alistipes sp.]|nr:tetratricopeptide repeat protein [Alistipes sp.]
MKRLIFAVLAVIVMATPVVNAQKVNKDMLIDKIANAEAATKNPKKSGKAATWINLGNAYYDAAIIPTKDLFTGVEYPVIEVAMGLPESKQDGVVLNGVTYTEMVYPWVKIYVANNKVITWIQTQNVKDEDLAMKALEAYKKAYEVEPKQASKVMACLKRLMNFLSMSGNADQDAARWGNAADNYYKAYLVQECPAFTEEKNASYLYFAGYLWVLDGNVNKKQDSYKKAVEAVNKALEVGYTDEKGDIYHFLYHSYNGQTDSSVREANMQRAKQLLMEGLSKFPSNDNIIAALIDIYTSDANVGDPTDLVKMIDAALERDPKNRDMWFGRGKVFYNLKNYDESIVSFKKVVELDPKDAQATFFIGYFYIAKGDAMSEEINKRDYKSSAEWKADSEKVTAVYKEALPFLEKAYELNPKDFSTVETLKILTFRLREEDGIGEKSEKYTKIYNDMKAAQ